MYQFLYACLSDVSADTLLNDMMFSAFEGENPYIFLLILQNNMQPCFWTSPSKHAFTFK